MSSNVDIGKNRNADLTAPTPQNTPLSNAPLTREALSKPTVGTIGEDQEGEAAAGAGAGAGGSSIGLPADAAAALAANPALAGLIQTKLDTLVGRSSGYLESLPDHVRRRIQGLKGLHVQHHKIEADFQKDILELEKKYAQRYAPLYDRRAQIIAGAVEPSSDEVKAGEQADDDEEEEDEEDEEEEQGTAAAGGKREKASLADLSIPADAAKGIPEFWLTALRNDLALNELITERDAEALKGLRDIRMSHLPSSESLSGFRLEFVFDPAVSGKFFKNETLTKTYYYQDEVGYTGDLVYDHADGCTIEWLPEQDLTHKIETKKQRNKNTHQTRTVKRSVPVESFFNFFSPPKPPTGDEEEDEEDAQELEERLELDYQLGEDFKDRIIPHAIDYFTGKVLEYQDLEDDDDDEEDDEDEYDEDDDDDDDDRAAPAAGNRARLGVSAGSAAAGSVEGDECRQS